MSEGMLNIQNVTYNRITSKVRFCLFLKSRMHMPLRTNMTFTHTHIFTHINNRRLIVRESKQQKRKRKTQYKLTFVVKSSGVRVEMCSGGESCCNCCYWVTRSLDTCMCVFHMCKHCVCACVCIAYDCYRKSAVLSSVLCVMAAWANHWLMFFPLNGDSHWNRLALEVFFPFLS